MTNPEDDSQTFFCVPFNVRSYEVDTSGEVTMASVCNYFQEAAGVHAHELNFDITHLLKNGLTWVLYKMQVEMDCFPKRWDDIIIETRPSSGDGIRAFREYRLAGKDGTVYGTGLSQWMVLNVKNRRPVRIPDEILRLGRKRDSFLLEADKKPITAVENGEPDFITRVGLHDLDMNNHVNNVQYIEWLTGFPKRKQHTIKKCTGLTIQYAAEAVLGDDIYLTQAELPAEGSNTIAAHTLCRNSTSNVIANAITHWR